MVKELVVGILTIAVGLGFKYNNFEWWWWLLLAGVLGLMIWLWGGINFGRKKLKIDWWIPVILLVALMARSWQIGSWPSGVWIDEIEISVAGQSYIKSLSSGQFLPFWGEATGHPALSMLISGVVLNMMDHSVAGLRWGSVIFASLSVVVFYCFLKELVKKEIARMVSFLVAGCYWHLTFSRIGFEAGYYWFFQALAFWFLVKAVKGQAKYWLWMGICLGLGIYTYLAFRILSLMTLGISVVVIGLSHNTVKNKIKHLAWAVLPFLLIIIPIFFFSRRFPDVVWFRSNDLSVFNHKFDGQIDRPKMIGDNILSAIRFLLDKPDPNIRHNPAQVPGVDIGVTILMIVGLIELVRQKKWGELAVAGLIGGISVAAGVFTYEPPYIVQPHSLRMLGLLLVVYTLVAYGLNRFKAKWWWIPVCLIWGWNMYLYFKPIASELYSTEMTVPQTRAAIEAGQKCPSELLRKHYLESHFHFFAPDCKPFLR